MDCQSVAALGAARSWMCTGVLTVVVLVATPAEAQQPTPSPPTTAAALPTAAAVPAAPQAQPATADPASSQTKSPDATATGATAADSTAAPAIDSVAPAPAASPASAEPAASAPAHHKVLMLPLTFTVYQNGVGSFEAVPDWTEAARKNLADAANAAVKLAGSLDLEPLPELEATDASALRNHVAVARLIVQAGGQHKFGEWKKHRADFDRSFGDGLRFLHERTGADYALLIDGSQVKVSGGRIFMQLALAAAGIIMIGGGGTVVSTSLLDLNTGQVTWFNSSLDVEILGMSGSDMRKPDTAHDVLVKLFSVYPMIPALAN